jgi:hypothetical protein
LYLIIGINECAESKIFPKVDNVNTFEVRGMNVHPLYIERSLFKIPIYGGVLLRIERDLNRLHGGCSRVAVGLQ